MDLVMLKPQYSTLIFGDWMAKVVILPMDMIVMRMQTALQGDSQRSFLNVVSRVYKEGGTDMECPALHCVVVMDKDFSVEKILLHRLPCAMNFLEVHTQHSISLVSLQLKYIHAHVIRDPFIILHRIYQWVLYLHGPFDLTFLHFKWYMTVIMSIVSDCHCIFELYVSTHKFLCFIYWHEKMLDNKVHLNGYGRP